MSNNLELDPLFDTSLTARLKRWLKGLLGTRYLFIAVLLHFLAIIIFGGKVIFENYQKVNLESQVLIAPRSDPSVTPPPPIIPQEKAVDVKVSMPSQNPKIMSQLSVPRLSENFNIATPDIQNSVSISMDGGMGGEVHKGVGTEATVNGKGFSSVNFFGIGGQVNNIIFCVDVSGSMKSGSSIGHSYGEVISQVARAVIPLNEGNEFNIITFAKGDYAFSNTMVPGTKEQKEKSIAWLRKLNPENFTIGKDAKDVVDNISGFHYGTRADLALEKAFKQKPTMIMFLSDGVPTNEGGTTELLKLAKKWRQIYNSKTVVNAVFYKTGNSPDNEKAKAFMSKLAQDHGGVFKSIE